MGSPEEKGLWQNRSWLVMRQGLLYRKVRRPGENVACMQFVLPTKYRKMAIQGFHDDVGHMGVAQSVNLLQDRFYWPGMAKEMTQHVRKCMRCNCFKKRAEQAPLEPLLATHPMQIIHIDFLTIESGKAKTTMCWWSPTSLPNLRRHLSPLPKLPKLLLKPCGTNILCIMDFQK